MGVDRLAHEREPQAGAVLFRGEVGLEDPRPEILGDPGPVVCDGDDASRRVARDSHVDRPAALHRLGRVAQQVGEGAPQRLVMTHHAAPPAVRLDRYAHAVGDPRAAQLFEQLLQVHLALGAFRHPPEVRELPRQPLQPVGLRDHDLHRDVRPTVRLSDSPTESIDRDSHRRQRVLDLVRHAPRDLPERPQPLGLELLVARDVERGGEIAE